MMNKVNLVTQKDRRGYYDTVRCTECGHTMKCYGLNRPEFCPKCETKKRPCKDIWGGWSTRPLSEIKCHFCLTPAIMTPKEGHPNSQYWKLQRTSEEYLFCCPLGCLEDGSITYKLRRRKNTNG